MKKKYFIALAVSFVTAIVCLGIPAAILSKSELSKQREVVEFFAKTFHSGTQVTFKDDSSWIFNVSDDNKVDARVGAGQSVALSAPDLKSLSVRVGQGNVHLVGGSSELKISASDLSSECEAVVSHDDGEYRIRLVGKPGFSRDECEGSLNIETPSQAKLKLRTGKGDINVSHYAGEMELKAGLGQIHIEDASGEIESDLGAGNISVAGKSAKVEVKVGMGNIDVILNEKLAIGSYSVKSGTGNISIQIPQGQIAEEKLKAGMGTVSGLNKTGEKSDFKIDGKTGVGNIIVKY